MKPTQKTSWLYPIKTVPDHNTYGPGTGAQVPLDPRPDVSGVVWTGRWYDLVLRVLSCLALVILSASLHAQERDSILLTGGVVSPEGQPLIAVSVVVKGTSHGTVTDFDGNFALKVAEGASVVVSCDGFSTFEIDNVSFSNIRVHPSNGTGSFIEICCINHAKSHCGITASDTQKLSKRKKCVFR